MLLNFCIPVVEWFCDCLVCERLQVRMPLRRSRNWCIFLFFHNPSSVELKNISNFQQFVSKISRITREILEGSLKTSEWCPKSNIFKKPHFSLSLGYSLWMMEQYKCLDLWFWIRFISKFMLFLGPYPSRVPLKTSEWFPRYKIFKELNFSPSSSHSL